MKRNKTCKLKISKWEIKNEFQQIEGKECLITLEPRPPYCDRGNWIAKVFPKGGLVMSLDSQDGWPRYYFDETRAKLEIEAWMKKRDQWISYDESRQKHYYVASKAGWFVIKTNNKRKAKTCGVSEFGSGNVWTVRLATENEIKNYISQKGKEAVEL